MVYKKLLHKLILFIKVFAILFLFGIIIPEVISMIVEYIRIGYPHRNSVLVNGSNIDRANSFINTFLQYIYMYFFD